MKSLTEYRQILEPMKGGTVPAELALEILHTAEAELEEARGELTIAQAMERSGKSRSFFERRVRAWVAHGFARKPGREWLIRAAAVPARAAHGGFDPSASEEDILAELERLDRAS